MSISPPVVPLITHSVFIQVLSYYKVTLYPCPMFEPFMPSGLWYTPVGYAGTIYSFPDKFRIYGRAQMYICKCKYFQMKITYSVFIQVLRLNGSTLIGVASIRHALLNLAPRQRFSLKLRGHHPRRLINIHIIPSDNTKEPYPGIQGNSSTPDKVWKTVNRTCIQSR